MVDDTTTTVSNADALAIEGWAVIDGGKINVRTVSPTRRAAIVSWLVIERGVPLFVGTSDEQVEASWAQLRGNAVAVPVTVMAGDPQQVRLRFHVKQAQEQ